MTTTGNCIIVNRTSHLIHMSKNRKSRRKIRNRKSLSSTGSTTTQHDHILTSRTSTTTVSSVTKLEPQHENDLLKSNSPDIPSSRLESSENKRKDLHDDMISSNDSAVSASRKKNKRRRTTTSHAVLLHDDNNKPRNDGTVEKRGTLYDQECIVCIKNGKNAHIEAKQKCYILFIFTVVLFGQYICYNSSIYFIIISCTK